MRRLAMTPFLTASGPLVMQTLREENAIRCEKLIFALLSDDARHIAGLGPGGFYLWQREPARQVASFPDPSHRAGGWSFTAWAFSPDGTTLAVSDMRGTVGFYRIQSGDLSRRLSVSESHLWAVTYSADDRLLGTTSADGFVRVWDIASSRLLWASQGAQVGFMRDVAFSPDGTIIAAVADDANVYVWDVSSGKLIHAFDTTLMANFGLAFARDGAHLAVGGANSEISLLNVKAGSLERTFGRERNVVAALKLSSRGDVLAARYRNPEDMTKPAPVILWDAASGKSRLKIDIPNAHFNSMAFNENEVIVTSWLDGAQHVWAVTHRAL
jgi:WD40 repeat protein